MSYRFQVQRQTEFVRWLSGCSTVDSERFPLCCLSREPFPLSPHHLQSARSGRIYPSPSRADEATLPIYRSSAPLPLARCLSLSARRTGPTPKSPTCLPRALAVQQRVSCVCSGVSTGIDVADSACETGRTADTGRRTEARGPGLQQPVEAGYICRW